MGRGVEITEKPEKDVLSANILSSEDRPFQRSRPNSLTIDACNGTK